MATLEADVTASNREASRPPIDREALRRDVEGLKRALSRAVDFAIKIEEALEAEDPYVTAEEYERIDRRLATIPRYRKACREWEGAQIQAFHDVLVKGLS